MRKLLEEREQLLAEANARTGGAISGVSGSSTGSGFQDGATLSLSVGRGRGRGAVSNLPSWMTKKAAVVSSPNTGSNSDR